MSYPYNGKLNPKTGGGLGGLPSPASGGGSKNLTYQNFDKNFYMSPADMGNTISVNTPNGYALFLPDARQLQKNSYVTIKNISTLNLLIVNNSGVGVKTLVPGDMVILSCTDITTSAGVWAASSNLATLFAGSVTSVKSAYTNIIQIAPLTSTTALAVYVNSSTGSAPFYLNSVVLTVSGTTITVGGETQIATGSYNYPALSICKLSSTLAIVYYVLNASPYSVNAICLSVSGTTITVGSNAQINSASSSGNMPSGSVYISALSATSAIAVYVNNTAYAVVLTVSGTTITVNTAYSLGFTTPGYICIAALSSTLAVVSYSDTNTASQGKAVAMSISGTVISVGTPVNVVSGSCYGYRAICAVDASTAVCLSVKDTSFNLVANVLSISGTTITVGATATLQSNNANQSNGIAISKLDTNLVLASYRNSSGYAEDLLLSVVGTDVVSATTPVASYKVSSTFYTGFGSAILDTKTAIKTHVDSSNYACSEALSYTV